MGTPWLPRSQGELVALVLPRGLSHVGSCTSPYRGGTVAQRSWGWGTKLFWIYPVALRFFLKMKNDSSFLNLVCLQQSYKEKRSDVVMYGSSIFEVFFSFFLFFGKVRFIRGFKNSNRKEGYVVKS